jgi:hypothetical protein
MPQLQTLISQQGPLPITQTFNFEADGDVIFSLSGSAWANEAGMLAFELFVDDSAVGFAYGFTNEGASHKTLVPMLLPWQLGFGEHKIMLIAEVNSPTITDQNDYFNVTLIY